MTTSTAAILSARQSVNASRKDGTRTPSRSGYSPSYQHSKSRNVVHGMALSDIAKNGFEVRCKETGIQFSILPDGAICDAFVGELEKHWNSGAR